MSRKRARDITEFPRLFIDAIINNDNVALEVAINRMDLTVKLDFELPKNEKFKHLFASDSEKLFISKATPLTLATICDNVTIMKKIIATNRVDIDAEAEINYESRALSYGATAASFAAINGNKQTMLLLGAAGADFDQGELSLDIPPFITAAMANRFDLMAIMITAGVKIDVENSKGGALYYAAIENNDLDIMQLLLLRNYDPNTEFTDDYGKKFKIIDELCLHYLESSNQVNLAKIVLLFSFGATISEEMRNKFLADDFGIIAKNLELLRVVARFSKSFEEVDIIDSIKARVIGEAASFYTSDCEAFIHKNFLEAFGCAKKQEDLTGAELLSRFMALKRFKENARIEDVVDNFNLKKKIPPEEDRDEKICDNIEILFSKKRLAEHDLTKLEATVNDINYLSKDPETKVLLEMLGVYEESVELMQEMIYHKRSRQPRISTIESSAISITAATPLRAQLLHAP